MEELEAFPSEVLKDEGDHSARLVRYETPDGAVVLKRWKPRNSRLYRLWARLLTGRELRFLAALEGCPGVPAFRGQLDPVTFVMEWVPGEPLRRQLDPARLEAALDQLEVVLDELHARRFVHLDLHQKLNVLVGAQGEVWLVDYGQGLFCDHVFRLLLPFLKRVDRRAVLKFRARYAPHTLPEATREQVVARYGGRSARGWKNFHRRLRGLLIGDRS